MNAVNEPPNIPLCVDLDGSLCAIDTLHESLLNLLRHAPAKIISLPDWISKGKAVFKSEVSKHSLIDAASLPYRPELLTWLREQRADGRKLILATAAHRNIAEGVAAHLGIFDEVLASDGVTNLSGENKRKALVSHYGEKGFDYVGNDAKDVIVWSSARHAVVVGGPALQERARRVTEVTKVFSGSHASARAWLKAIRIHQWVKNVLIFLPAMLAHKILDPAILTKSILAFVAYGLCASSVYVINDLLDLASDRRHPRKRNRPFASGALPAKDGLIVAMLLLISAAVIAIVVNWWFCAVLVLYYVVTWAYTLRLKRAALVDVMTLAGLYTLRIIAGAAATTIQPSFWLLAFSIFIFLSLGIVKRYSELEDARKAAKSGGHGRGYSADDLTLLMSLGTASGFCSIVVMALYLNSNDSQMLYKHSKPLWLICPLMLYWVSRVWLLAARGQMEDDPVVFAVRDRISLAVIVLIGLIVFVSI